ncbi:MAG: ISKra4 family transposase, partial [Proteobacteria bacterium]|nr:ISKra4 family transposase [Pseudomonadota bacterium]
MSEQLFLQSGKLARPFSESAGVTQRGYSLCLQRAIVDFGADVPFNRVVGKMQEHYGIEVPVSSCRLITETHGEKILKNGESFESYAVSSSGDAAAIVVESDGCMIPIVEFDTSKSEESEDNRKKRKCVWKEAKLTLARKIEEIKPHFMATTGSVEDVGDQMLNCARYKNMGEDTRIHCVGDGAPWIANQCDRVFGTNGGYLVDFGHLCEYVAAAAKTCGPDDEERWTNRQKALLKQSEADTVVSNLNLLPEGEVETGSKDNENPVRICRRYIENRPGQFDYKSALEADLPIGSGEIESAHRYVIQNRLKIAGAWW